MQKNTHPGFKITNGKGFHITFANGNTVSVQFGPGNYSENYDAKIGEEDAQCGADGSGTAEVFAWDKNGESLMEVEGWQTPAQVLEFLNKFSS